MARGESPVLSRTVHDSPRLRSSPGRNDSPSRQQLAEIELQKTIAKLTLLDAEQHKVYIAQKSAFQEELDAREEAQAVSQLSQIKQAIASHHLAREQAEAVLQAHLDAEREKERQRLAEEKQRQEDEERRKQEAERRAKEEQERKVREQTEREETAKRAEAERVRLEEERRRNEAEEAERRDKERQEQERQKAEADAQAQAQAAKQREEEAKKAATPAPAPPESPATAQRPAAPVQATSSDIEKAHQSYLNIHKRLKKFRKDFWETCKSNKAIKNQVGDMRRDVRTAVGQLRLDGGKHNTVAIQKVKAILIRTLNETIIGQRVPVNDYLPPHHALPDNTISIPALTIYILSVLSKFIINVTITSCIDNPRAGEAPSMMAAQIFASEQLWFSRPNPPTQVTLISILLSKYHASAPMLFGISGLESSQKGRIGWRTTTVDAATGRKAYVAEQTQYDRLVGLAAGYAALSLRNFSRAKTLSPCPPRDFWTSLAHLVNTPPEQVQVSHLILLKSLLENSVERIVQFFGATGVAALRQATVVLPGRLPQEMRGHATVKALGILREKWAKELRFHLT